MEIQIVKLIGQGNTAEIYRLEGQKILKLYRLGLPSVVIEREYQNGLMIQDILDHVPRTYEIVKVQERSGIVFEEIHGKDLLKVMLSSPWKINAYSRKLAHYHLEIQKPVSDALWSVKEKLRNDLEGVETLSDEYREVILRQIDALPDGVTLCHFDFHPGNIMISEQKAIVLDWMTACRGDACADVARTGILLKYGEVLNAPWLVKRLISLFQRHIYKIYIEEYLSISGKSMEQIEQWELPVIAARLREWISDHERQVLLDLVSQRCQSIINRILLPCSNGDTQSKTV